MTATSRCFSRYHARMVFRGPSPRNDVWSYSIPSGMSDTGAEKCGRKTLKTLAISPCGVHNEESLKETFYLGMSAAANVEHSLLTGSFDRRAARRILKRVGTTFITRPVRPGEKFEPTFFLYFPRLEDKTI